MKEKTKHQIVCCFCGLAALALGLTSIAKEDWSEFKVEDGTLTIGPFRICITIEAGLSESVNCTSISNLTNPDDTSLDEFKALLITSIGGGFGGWALLMAALACSNYRGANVGVTVMSVSDICHVVGLSLFSTEDSCNFGISNDDVTEEFQSPFYISIASLILKVGTSCIGKYAINVAKKAINNNTTQSSEDAGQNETNV